MTIASPNRSLRKSRARGIGEAVVVLVVAFLLAGSALATVRTLRSTAAGSACARAVRVLEDAVEARRVLHGEYPTSLGVLEQEHLYEHTRSTALEQVDGAEVLRGAGWSITYRFFEGPPARYRIDSDGC